MNAGIRQWLDYACSCNQGLPSRFWLVWGLFGRMQNHPRTPWKQGALRGPRSGGLKGSFVLSYSDKLLWILESSQSSGASAVYTSESPRITGGPIPISFWGCMSSPRFWSPRMLSVSRPMLPLEQWVSTPFGVQQMILSEGPCIRYHILILQLNYNLL